MDEVMCKAWQEASSASLHHLEHLSWRDLYTKNQQHHSDAHATTFTTLYITLDNAESNFLCCKYRGIGVEYK